jgi:hypothetical protein
VKTGQKGSGTKKKKRKMEGNDKNFLRRIQLKKEGSYGVYTQCDCRGKKTAGQELDATNVL